MDDYIPNSDDPTKVTEVVFRLPFIRESWTYAKKILDQRGFQDSKAEYEADLDNPIHPLVDRRMWGNIKDEDFERITPALRLVSLFLTDDRVLDGFYHATVGLLREEDGKCYYARNPMQDDPAQRSVVRDKWFKKLEKLRKAISFDIGELPAGPLSSASCDVDLRHKKLKPEVLLRRKEAKLAQDAAKADQDEAKADQKEAKAGPKEAKADQKEAKANQKEAKEVQEKAKAVLKEASVALKQAQAAQNDQKAKPKDSKPESVLHRVKEGRVNKPRKRKKWIPQKLTAKVTVSHEFYDDMKQILDEMSTNPDRTVHSVEWFNQQFLLAQSITHEIAHAVWLSRPWNTQASTEGPEPYDSLEELRKPRNYISYEPGTAEAGYSWELSVFGTYGILDVREITDNLPSWLSFKDGDGQCTLLPAEYAVNWFRKAHWAPERSSEMVRKLPEVRRRFTMRFRIPEGPDDVIDSITLCLPLPEDQSNKTSDPEEGVELSVRWWDSSRPDPFRIPRRPENT